MSQGEAVVIAMSALPVAVSLWVMWLQRLTAKQLAEAEAALAEADAALRCLPH